MVSHSRVPWNWPGHTEPDNTLLPIRSPEPSLWGHRFVILTAVRARSPASSLRIEHGCGSQSLELSPLINRSSFDLRSPFRAIRGTFSLLSFLSVIGLSLLTLGLCSCGQNLYRTPAVNFAGRPTPPSLLQQRVMVAITANGSIGSLEILDGLRDIRSNIENTRPSFFISGFSGGLPTTILNFPEQLRGVVYSDVAPYGVTYITARKPPSARPAASPPAAPP